MRRIFIVQLWGNNEISAFGLEDHQSFFKLDKWWQGPSQEDIREMLEEIDHPQYVSKERETLIPFNIDLLEFSKGVLK